MPDFRFAAHAGAKGCVVGIFVLGLAHSGKQEPSGNDERAGFHLHPTTELLHLSFQKLYPIF